MDYMEQSSLKKPQYYRTDEKAYCIGMDAATQQNSGIVGGNN